MTELESSNNPEEKSREGRRRKKRREKKERPAKAGGGGSGSLFGLQAGLSDSSLKALEDMTLGDSELEALYSRVQKRINQFDDEIDQACKANGISREDLEAYLANPENFSPSEWKEIKEVSDAWHDVLDVKKKGKAHREAVAKAPEKGKGTKALRAKTLGNRKGWLPM